MNSKIEWCTDKGHASCFQGAENIINSIERLPRVF